MSRTLERSRPSTQPVPAREPPWARTLRAATFPLVLWAALVTVAAVWGRWLMEHGLRLAIDAPPLTGHWELRLSAWTVPVVVLAIGAVAAGPGLAERSRWRALLAGSFALAAGWAMLLALTDGTAGLLGPVNSPAEYLHDARLIAGPGEFLDGFVEGIRGYTVHVRSHPPGMVMLVWALGRLGLGGAWPVAVLEVLGLAAAAPAALVAFREVAGEERARAAAPFVVLAPAAVFATSGDALFAGVGVWAIALVVLSTGRGGRRAEALALGGGALFGAGLLLSYGLVPLALVPVSIAIARRRARPLALAALSATVVVLVPLATGFWWIEGFLATRIEYAQSVAHTRPHAYFLVANVAAFALALGPAIAVALGRLRDRTTWLLAAPALAAVALADLSGLSKGEVERIWLPFAPFVLLAASALGDLTERRRWLAVQAGAAVVLQLALVSPW